MGLASSGVSDAEVPVVFWRSTLYPPVLAVRAEPCGANDPDGIDLLQLPCAIVVRRALDGHEEILFTEGPRCIRLEVIAGTLLAGPARLTYELSGFIEVEPKLLTLRRLLALRRLGRLPRALFPPERRARRWAQALQAFDAARAGATYREIATVLFGRDRVESDWAAGDDMRMRIRRLIRTAEQLVEKGWLDLLRA